MPVINLDKGVPRVELVQPNPYGYVFVLAEVDPASVTTDVDRVGDIPLRADIPSTSAKRAALYQSLKAVRGRLAGLDQVRAVSVFEAALFQPERPDKPAPSGSGGRPARYDSVMLIETGSPAEAESLLSDPVFGEVRATVERGSTYTNVLPVRNVKKVDDVDRAKDGVFLFNFFFGADKDDLLDIWDYTAGWWLAEGNMLNSELMMPLGKSDYAVINNARWDDWDDAHPAVHAFRKTSYREFVMANLDASGATAMPTLYRLVA